MKNLLLSSLLLITLFISHQANAQLNRGMQEFFDEVTLEVGAGWHVTAGPTKDTPAAAYASLNSFYGGMNYALNDTWGIRGTYTFHNFQHKDLSELDLQTHRFMLEATYSLGNLFSQDYFYSYRSDFDVIAHAGFGGSFAFRKNHPTQRFRDQMLNAQIGVMPTVRLSETVSIHFDFNYVLTISQNYLFNGELYWPENTAEAYMTMIFGVSYDLGGW